MKKIFITCAAILALFSSCTSVLDKEDPKFNLGGQGLG